tara:strand:+ start:162 stop:371 length:210 start_codon:yes stop_codon:yes gene_type:complete
VAALIRHFLGVTYHPGHVNRLLKQWGWDRREALRSTHHNDRQIIAGWCRWSWPQWKKKLLKHHVLQAVA